ncbi:hypothetical protein BDV96DRAFT_600078 [Lophiotrema nucula]|uniref:Uncharacterized protein n=1 Tax=Lophiotrema nucula TaxID=690887 RepID=A0A6A5Z822_9PLEO|nr:hypothetical protein BDV96DRAFT_600078 [Lophiotrema nucula]
MGKRVWTAFRHEPEVEGFTPQVSTRKSTACTQVALPNAQKSEQYRPDRARISLPRLPICNCRMSTHLKADAVTAYTENSRVGLSVTDRLGKAEQDHCNASQPAHSYTTKQQTASSNSTVRQTTKQYTGGVSVPVLRRAKTNVAVLDAVVRRLHKQLVPLQQGNLIQTTCK